MGLFIKNIISCLGRGRATSVLPTLFLQRNTEGFRFLTNTLHTPMPIPHLISQRGIITSATLFAEPLKKKKRLDPAIIRAREERKKRKLEKQIRRLEKFQRQLKPLDELEIPACIIDQPRVRERKLPQLPMEVTDSRWKLVKEWGVFKLSQTDAELHYYIKIRRSQEKALEELRKESEVLYQAAVVIDTDFIPYEVKGPTETPPIPNYVSPDGDYVDVSRKWD